MTPKKLTQAQVDKALPRPVPYELRDPGLTGFLVRIQPTGRKTFYVQYGRGRREKLGVVGVHTFEQARTKALKLLHEVAEHGEPLARMRSDATLGEFIRDRYAPWATAHHRSAPDTLKRLSKCFEADFYGKRLAEVNAWVVEKWRGKRLKAGIQKTTINRDVTGLKSVLSKAVEWSDLSEHPLAKVKPIRTDTRGVVRYLTEPEESRLREALAARDERLRKARASANEWRSARGYELRPKVPEYADHLTPAVLLSVNTGLRQGELLALEWGDVDLKRKQITVRGATAKSAQTRHIPLNAEALAVLATWHKQNGKPAAGLLFPNRHGRKITEIKTAWGKLIRQAEIPRFRWHDLRHHFASRLVMAGVDLNTVRELLGHGDIKMTLRYAHLAPEHKARAVERLTGGRK